MFFPITARYYDLFHSFNIFFILFSFDLYDYYQTNIVFNKIHRSSRSAGIEYFWYRPRSYSLFLLSGLPIVFLAYSKLADKKITLKNFQRLTYPFAIIFIALIIFLLSMNDRDHHALIFLIPMIFSIILFFEKIISRNISHIISLILIIGYPNILSLKNIYSTYANVRDDKFLTMKREKDILVINEMIKNEDLCLVRRKGMVLSFFKY